MFMKIDTQISSLLYYYSWAKNIVNPYFDVYKFCVFFQNKFTMLKLYSKRIGIKLTFQFNEQRLEIDI